MVVFPAATSARISGSNTCTCVHFSLDIILPPDVEISFSYIRGSFVYCPFFTDLFNFSRVFVVYSLQLTQTPLALKVYLTPEMVTVSEAAMVPSDLR